MAKRTLLAAALFATAALTAMAAPKDRGYMPMVAPQTVAPAPLIAPIDTAEIRNVTAQAATAMIEASAIERAVEAKVDIPAEIAPRRPEAPNMTRSQAALIGFFAILRARNSQMGR